MIRYWYYTGDASNNAAIIQGMNRQSGQNDFFPANYSRYMTNADQQIWALAAMTAAELDFPQETSKAPWINMAENAFNEQIRRWDSGSCGGGLRWLVSPDELGWTIKNAISNGGLFELSARLARYTNNQTYVDWAEKVWDWSTRTLIDTSDWTVHDSVSTLDDCKRNTVTAWTLIYGSYISGTAYMSNLVSRQTDSSTAEYPRTKTSLRRTATATRRNGRRPSKACSPRAPSCSSPRNTAGRSSPKSPASP